MNVTADMRPYRPVGSNLEIIRSRDREVVASGPAGTGKSCAFLTKIHLACEKYPGARFLMMRKTRASLTNSAMVSFENDVVPVGHPVLRGAKRNVRTSYRYPNGSEIVVIGLDDADGDKVLSSEWDGIYGQECTEFTEAIWQKAITRLRGRVMPYRQIMGDCNPDRPRHWVKQREGDGALRLIECDHRDNPRWYDVDAGEWTPEGIEYIQETLGKLRGYERERFLLGRWVSAEGAVWPQLDDRIHVFDDEKMFPEGIEGGRWILGIDYGKRAPYCCLVIWESPDGDFYVMDEDYESGLTPDQQAERMVALAKNRAIWRCRADPSTWNQIPNYLATKTQVQPKIADFYEKAFRKAGFGPLEPGYNRSRIIAIGQLSSMFDHGNEYPSIYVSSRCTNLWDELTGAVWDNRTLAANIREDLDPKCPDHAITALYYGTIATAAPQDKRRGEVIRPVSTTEQIRSLYANAEQRDRKRLEQLSRRLKTRR